MLADYLLTDLKGLGKTPVIRNLRLLMDEAGCIRETLKGQNTELNVG